MADETGKQSWHVFLFFVWPRCVYRGSSSAILRYFVHAGDLLELGGRRREVLVSSELDPLLLFGVLRFLQARGRIDKGCGTFSQRSWRPSTYEPQACQSAGESRTSRRYRSP